MGGGQPSLSGPTGSPPPFRLPNYSPSTGPLPLSEDPVQPHGQVVPGEGMWLPHLWDSPAQVLVL